MIRVGIGGWNFAPWRGAFFPKGLPQKDELAFASRHVTAIEVNATFYRTQSPQTFRKWAQEAPNGFVFAVKAHRVVTHRRELAQAGPTIERFLASGLVELGEKLGPILWQMPPTKRFEPDDFGAFLALLPKALDGHRLRHVVEVRHETFRDARLAPLLAQHRVALCLAESEKYPMLAALTGEVAYLRLQRARATLKAGYPPKELATWADRVRALEKGEVPEQAALGDGDPIPPKDVFVFMIDGAKERAPMAAMAFMQKLGIEPFAA